MRDASSGDYVGPDSTDRVKNGARRHGAVDSAGSLSCVTSFAGLGPSTGVFYGALCLARLWFASLHLENLARLMQSARAALSREQAPITIFGQI